MDEKHNKRGATPGFVADGHRRARTAAEPQVQAEVEREFADRLEHASGRERARLLREMEREIKRRIRGTAPPDALY